MNTIEKILINETNKLKNIIIDAEKRLKHAPEGALRVANKKNKVEYFYKKEEDKGKNGRYMKKSELILAKRIAQRDYDMQLIKNARERKYAIDKFLQRYQKTDLKELYKRMNPYRKALISAVEIMDDIEYMNATVYKLHTYEKNGIYLGIKLFLSFETSRFPLNTKALDGIIKTLFDN